MLENESDVVEGALPRKETDFDMGILPNLMCDLEQIM